MKIKNIFFLLFLVAFIIPSAIAIGAIGDKIQDPYKANELTGINLDTPIGLKVYGESFILPPDLKSIDSIEIHMIKVGDPGNLLLNFGITNKDTMLPLNILYQWNVNHNIIPSGDSWYIHPFDIGMVHSRVVTESKIDFSGYQYFYYSLECTSCDKNNYYILYTLPSMSQNDIAIGGIGKFDILSYSDFDYKIIYSVEP